MIRNILRIVYLGNYNQTEKLSGPEKGAKRLFHQSKLCGHDPVFLEYYFKDYEDCNFLKRLFGFNIIKNDPKVIRAGIFRTIFFIMTFRPHIIHIVTYKRYIIAILFLKLLFKSRIVVTFHGIMKYEINKSRIKQKRYDIIKDLLLEKLFITKSDLLVFLSYVQLEMIKKYYKIYNEKVAIIPNGIDEVFFNKKKQINRTNKLKIVFYNGFSHEVKGVNILFEIMSHIQNKNVEVFLLGNVPAGTTTSYTHVAMLSVNELSKFLSDKQIYINIAEYEPFSLMAVEAMASGLITIVSDRVGMKRYIHHGENGFVFNYHDKYQLLSILNSILEREVDLNTISKNATRIYKKLNWHDVAKLYFDSYSRLLNV